MNKKSEPPIRSRIDNTGGGAGGESPEAEPSAPEPIIELPVDGVLDLHTFQPREVKDLVPEYLAECRRRGITRVRIIHGKGTGVLRRIVQGVLEKDPAVVSFRTADLGGGSWGATEVELRPADPEIEKT